MLYRKPILMYHSTSENPHLPVNVTPANLESHLELIRSLGFHCSSIQDHLNDDTGMSIAMSFDDGYINNLSILSLLEKFKAGATFFVLTRQEGVTLECHKPYDVPLMGPNGWRELNSRGFEIAAHGRTHRKLSQISDNEIKQEILGSIQDIKDAVGIEQVGYAYPFGDMGNVQAGYKVAKAHAAYACSTRYMFPVGENRWRMRRINVGKDDTVERLKLKLSKPFRILCDLGY